MVSFQCDACADTVKKPKLDQHRQRCHAPFTCLDCSTTFQGQEYKSHTSCISEAQKYQGALYKGPKKGKQPYKPPQPTFTEAPPPPLPNPSAPSSPSGSATPAIHPSRLNQLQQNPTPSFNTFSPPSHSDRGGYARGNGGFRGGRGGFSNGGGSSNGYPTSENRIKSSSGMRSWGSPVVTEDSLPINIANPVVVEVEAVKKKKKGKGKKGDKGGTGAKAGVGNGRAKSEVADGDVEGQAEPQKKKRKREEGNGDEGGVGIGESEVVPTEKTLKRLKKNLSKLEKGGEGELILADWLSKAGKGKDGSLDSAQVLKGLKVSLTDGKWVLTA